MKIVCIHESSRTVVASLEGQGQLGKKRLSIAGGAPLIKLNFVFVGYKFHTIQCIINMYKQTCSTNRLSITQGCTQTTLKQNTSGDATRPIEILVVFKTELHNDSWEHTFLLNQTQQPLNFKI